MESQQKKLAYEAKLLEESDIQRIYQGNGGKETISFAKDITNTQSSLDKHLSTFIEQNEQSRIVFVNQDKHWMTVRLEKTPEGGMTYKVADSLEGHGAETRMKQIDNILVGICTKIPLQCTNIPFKSEKQDNSYDCGIFCALNAVDMKPIVVDGVKYSNAKATYSTDDVDTIRKNFEKELNKTKQQQQQRRPSRVSTASSLSGISNRSHYSQLQRPLSAGSQRSRSNISMITLNKLKDRVPKININRYNINKSK